MLCHVTPSSTLEIYIHLDKYTQPHCPQRSRILYNNVHPLIYTKLRQEQPFSYTTDNSPVKTIPVHTMNAYRWKRGITWYRCITLTATKRVMGGCFGGGKLTKKLRNRWTKLGGMLQIYSIHRPVRPQGGHGPKTGQSTMEKTERTQLHSFFNLALEGG